MGISHYARHPGGDMRLIGKLITIITILFLATTSFAADISESDVKIFLNDWLAAQNKGSYSDYAAMYSKSFVGIKRSGKSTHKFDYEGWLKDRKKMFSKKMLVSANFPEIRISGARASIKFEQTWESGTYRDKGDKVLDLVLEDEKLRIIREEMLFSKVASILHAEQGTYKSRFTSIKSKDCNKSKKLVDVTGEWHVEECSGLGGWRLFKVYEHEGRSWIDIAYDRSIWSTQNQVWNDPEYNFGHFPRVDAPQVEWRTTQAGEVRSLIFTVTAQNPEVPNSFLYRLFVISLSSNSPSFCGMVKTNREARELADKSTRCSTKLEKRTLP